MHILQARIAGSMHIGEYQPQQGVKIAADEKEEQESVRSGSHHAGSDDDIKIMLPSKASVKVCMHVCMYIFMYLHVFMYVFTCIHVILCVYIYVYM
jgi:hypothetical protein